MAKIAVDFSDVPASFIPDGQYQAVINKVELKTSKTDPSSQYLNWEFEGVEGDATARKFIMMTSLKPAALFGLRDALDTLGLDASAAAELEVDEDSGLLIDPDLSGIPVTVQITSDTYQGITRNKVQKIIECHRPFGQDAEEAEVMDEPPAPVQTSMDFEVAATSDAAPDMTGYVDLEIPSDSSSDEEEPV